MYFKVSSDQIVLLNTDHVIMHQGYKTSSQLTTFLLNTNHVPKCLFRMLLFSSTQNYSPQHNLCSSYAGLHKLRQPGSRTVRKWRENEKRKRKSRENEEMEKTWKENEEMERFSLLISSFPPYFLPVYPFPISEIAIFCRKILNTPLLLRMSQKT